MLNILPVVGVGVFIVGKKQTRVLCLSGKLNLDIALIAGKKNNVRISGKVLLPEPRI
jgi:hypothetical protein